MADEIPDLLAHLDMTCRHGVDLDMDECDECAACPVPQGTEVGPDQADRLRVARRRLADPIDIALNGNPYADALTEILALCDRTTWILNANDVRAVYAKHLGEDV